MDKLDEILRRVEAKELTEDDCETIRTVVDVLRQPDGAGRGQEHEPSLACGRCSSARRPRRPRRWSAAAGRELPRTRWLAAATAPPKATGRRNDAEGQDDSTDSHAAQRPRPQRGRRLRRRREDRGASRVAPAGRSLPEVRARARSTRRAVRACWCGWSGQPPMAGQGLLSPEAALQSVRRGLHGRAARGRWRGEVRRHGRQHDRAAEIRQRDALQPPREACKGTWAFPCRPRPSGTSSSARPSSSSRPSRN